MSPPIRLCDILFVLNKGDGVAFQATAASNQQQSTVQEQIEDAVSQDSNSDTGPRTPPSKNSVIGLSAASTPVGSLATSNVSAHNLSGVSSASTSLPGSSSVRAVPENIGPVHFSSPLSLSSSAKEEDSLPGRRSSPSLSDTGLVRGIGRGGPSSQPSASISLSSSNVVPSNGTVGAIPSTSDMTKRNVLGADDRLGSGMVQPLVSPLSNRMILPQVAKANDGTAAIDSSNVGEPTTMAGRVFSPPIVPGMQWRPGSAFQNQNEAVCYTAPPYLLHASSWWLSAY